MIGDLLVKLGRGSTLTIGELETLRLEMNRLQNAASRLDTVMAPTGGLDPNVFQNSPTLSLLPHDSLGLTKDSAQSIANAGYTTITWNEASASNWRHGMTFTPAISPTTIQIAGHGGESVYLVSFDIQWASDTTGYREIRISAEGIAQPFTVSSSPTGVLLNQGGTLVVQARTDGANFYLEAAQDTAGALDINAGRFSVVRLR